MQVTDSVAVREQWNLIIGIQISVANMYRVL